MEEKRFQYLIIGNSTAAVGCVEGIRSAGGTESIAIVSEEPHHTYSRPLISYLCMGRTDEERMKYRPDDFYEKNGCTLYMGVRAVRIEPREKTLLLADGRTLGYEKLLIAAGSRPFVPDFSGIESVLDKHTFMSLDDAHGLMASLRSDSRVLIIGAGLIGLKCAEGILERVGSVTVVDMADRILPSILDADGARIMQDFLEERGVRFVLSDSVARFSGGRAVLTSGKELAFDTLVICVGVRPNTALAEEAGCRVNRGIVTDSACQTSVSGIYAAGDCATSLDCTTGTERVLALLPNAYMQGYAAGVNMAGGNKQYENAMPMNAIGFFGLHVLSAGSYEGDAYTVSGEKSYKKLVTRDGCLCGFILIGDIERAGIYTALIRNKTPLDSIDFELIREKPQLMAFSLSDRKIKLGGAK